MSSAIYIGLSSFFSISGSFIIFPFKLLPILDLLLSTISNLAFLKNFALLINSCESCPAPNITIELIFFDSKIMFSILFSFKNIFNFSTFFHQIQKISLVYGHL